MIDLNKLKASYQQMWDTVVITPSRVQDVTKVAQRLMQPQAKAIYQSISRDTGVPWYDIAVIHEREASGAWWANIAQGDPWRLPSTHTPRGRGPFRNFHDAAVDALKNCPPYMAKNLDWSIGGQLIHLVQYNGLGYESKHNEWSPYIWAATNHEERGKYVTDGHFDPSVWDTQLGTAALLKRMFELDPTLTSGGAAS